MPRPANFAEVNDRVWRGARPTAEQARWLEAAGVRTVVNLEWEQSDDDIFAFPGSAARIVRIRIRDFEPLPWFAPSVADEHVVRALLAIRAALPVVYVHCRSGQNRTGVVIAAYRIVVLRESVEPVVTEFETFRGIWAWGDARYIRTITQRRRYFESRVR